MRLQVLHKISEKSFILRAGRIYTLLVLCTLAGVSNLQGQDYIYTLNQFTPLNFNPASVAIDNDASISFLNRRTQIAAGTHFSNNVFTGEYPIIDKNNGRRFGGLGINFTKKDAGSSDLLKTHTIGFSAAYNLPVAAHQFLVFGLQSNYNNKRTSLENLTTGSQWLASEFRFDPNAAQGESLTSDAINYFAINTGLIWNILDPKTNLTKSFVAVSAFNLNKPSESFFQDQSRIPVGYLFNAGAIVYQSQVLQITPQILYRKDEINDQTNLLVAGKVFFRNENPYDIIQSGSLEILSRYDFAKDLALGIVIHQPGVSFGFSYNFGLGSGTEQYFRNGSEFGIRLSKTLWKHEPKKVEIKSTSIAPKRNFNFSEPPPSQPGPVEKSDTEIIQDNIRELSDVKAVQFHLEKNFKFAFGRTELNDDAKQYLDEVYALLEKNPDYNIEVIGHTDNVGKHHINYKLSEGRAQAVAEYLIQRGLSKERIKFHGKGDKDPVAPNDTEENRSKNRRVEFLIYINR